MRPLDVNGAKVFGSYKVEKARVFWQDGKLYIVTPPFTLRVFDVPDEPRKSAGTYKVTTTDGIALRIQRPTCGCQKDATLGRMSREEIIARGALVDA